MTTARGTRLRAAVQGAWRAVRAVAANLSRQSFELFVMALAVLAGARGLWSNQDSGSPIDHLLPPWARWIWYGGLFLGGILTTLGVATSKADGSAVERSGLLILLGVSLSYCVLAFSIGGAGVAQGLTVSAFALCVAARIWSINLESEAISAAIRLIKSTLDGDR